MTATVKRGDTVAITLTVTAAAENPADPDIPVDLTGCTALRVIASLQTNTEPGEVLTPVTVTDAPNGEVQHQLSGTLAHGTYDVEFEFLDPEGVKITAPTLAYGKLIVERDLDTAP